MTSEMKSASDGWARATTAMGEAMTGAMRVPNAIGATRPFDPLAIARCR